MKIKITEIEASAEELRSSQTFASAFTNALRKAFISTPGFEEPTEEGADDE